MPTLKVNQLVAISGDPEFTPQPGRPGISFVRVIMNTLFSSSRDLKPRRDLTQADPEVCRL